MLASPVALTAFLDGYNPETHTVTLAVTNTMFLPIQVRAVTVSDVVVPLDNDVVLQARLHGQERYLLRKPFTHRWSEPVQYHMISVLLPRDMEWSETCKANLKLQYSIYGARLKSLRRVNPEPLLEPKILSEDIIRRPANVQKIAFLQIDPDQKAIIIQPGTHRLDESLILPPGYRIRSRSGTILELANHALILSFSPLDFVGSQENPIIIRATDNGQGLAVINTGKDHPSELRYVIFDGLTNPRQGNWELTSAVTFYQSPVTIDHCQFINNQSEDGLNIVRGEFDISHTWFADTFSDAFDADYATGCFSNCSFARCGNDALDVSGSRVDLAKIDIVNCGDKGISGGELSYIEAKDISISRSEIAIAAKDFSDISIKELALTDCRVGFALYQKKPEYGPALIDAEQVTSENILEPYLVEKGSILNIDLQKISGQREKVEDMLYGVQYGKSSH